VHVESPESSEATCKPFSRGLTLVSGTFKITSVAALEALSLPVPTCTHCKEKASVALRLLNYLKSHNALGSKGPSKAIQPNPPAVSRDISNLTRLLRAPSNLTWNVSNILGCSSEKCIPELKH